MATQQIKLLKLFNTACADMSHMAYDGVSIEQYQSWYNHFTNKAAETLSPRSLSTLRNIIQSAWKSHTQFNVAFCYVRDGILYRTTIRKDVKGVSHTTGELHDEGLTSKQWDQMGHVSVWCHTGTIYDIGKTPAIPETWHSRMSLEDFRQQLTANK